VGPLFGADKLQILAAIAAVVLARLTAFAPSFGVLLWIAFVAATLAACFGVAFAVAVPTLSFCHNTSFILMALFRIKRLANLCRSITNSLSVIYLQAKFLVRPAGFEPATLYPKK